jgi:hypothetical protein
MRFLPGSLLFSGLLAVSLTAGCRKPAESTATNPAPKPAASVSIEGAGENAPPPPPTPAAGQDGAEAATAAAPANPAGDEVDPNLRAILVKFYNEQLHPAQSWDELMIGKYITKIPHGPDGKPLDWNKTMAAMGRAAGAGR